MFNIGSWRYLSIALFSLFNTIFICAWLSQGGLNDLQRDLNLPKQASELLASRFQEWQLLGTDVKVTATRDRCAYLAEWFSMRDKIWYCKDIAGLFAAFKEPFVARD